MALFLSGTFLSAATAKLHGSWGLRLTVRELLPSLPRTFVQGIAFAVIGIELLVALSFISGPRPLGMAGSVGACLLTASFTAAFILSRRLPHGVRCNCFGRIGPSTLSGHTLAISATLAASAVGWVLVHGQLATFAAYQLRLAAVLPSIAILIVHRVPALGSARAPRRPVRSIDASRNRFHHHGNEL